MPVRGGPTWPCGPPAPGIAWQDVHPYLRTAARPRSGSPAVVPWAARTVERLQPAASAAAITPAIAAATEGSRITGHRHSGQLRPAQGHAPLGLADPGRDQGETEHEERDPGRDPHVEAGELLVGQR